MSLKMKFTDRDVTLVFLIILAVSLAMMVLCGCEWLCDAHDATKGAGTIGRTIKEVDADKSGNISFEELISYILGGYFSGRAIETGVKFGAKKVKNGRSAKHGSQDCKA